MADRVLENNGYSIVVTRYSRRDFEEMVNLANQYDKEAHELEKEKQNEAALEKRLIAAENFMNIGSFKKAAGAYGNAGLNASFLHRNYDAIEYKLNSAMLHFAIWNYEDAAYALAYASKILHFSGEKKLRDETARLSIEFFKRSYKEPKKESIKNYLLRFNCQQQP
jgi:hypothetical protein